MERDGMERKKNQAIPIEAQALALGLPQKEPGGDDAPTEYSCSSILRSDDKAN